MGEMHHYVMVVVIIRNIPLQMGLMGLLAVI